MTERPEERDEVPATEEAPSAGGANVPIAQGTTSAYTTGTLEPGEVGPAVDKPEHEGPTQGEGPLTEPIQADETGE